jgi:hypothetical protein
MALGKPDCSTGQQPPMLSHMKVLALRRSDECSACGIPLEAGTKAVWDPARRQVRCLTCQDSETAPIGAKQPHVGVTDEPAMPVQPSAGGASAQREYDRRSDRRERQIRARHSKLGGLFLALSKEPTATRVWAQGAAGERAVAAKLGELTGQHVVALHDRRMRRPDGKLSRANIDHIAISANGVWIIDAKTHQGALEVRRSGGLFSPRVESLYINGRDRTALVHGLLEQVATVRREFVAVHADVPVQGALCFVGTELPWFGSSSIADVPLMGRRGLAKLLRAPGEFGSEDRQAVAMMLDRRFPPA